MSFDIIVAVDNKNGIGRDNYIPWHITDDMKFFKHITTNTSNPFHKNAVIMGSQTWRTLPNKFLINRINIIISNSLKEKDNEQDLYFVKSLDNALEKAKLVKAEKIFVIGGESIYNLAISHNKLNNVYLTCINNDYKCNKFFNFINKDIFTETILNKINILDNNDKLFTVTFYKYSKKEHEELQYINLIKRILETGHYRDTRNAKTFSIFGNHMTFYIKDCGDGYYQVPISPLKKMFNRGIFEELKFFLLGQTDAKILDNKGVKVWNGNTSKDFIEKSNLKYDSGEHKDEYYAEGTLGPAYGFQWRYYNAEYLGPEVDYTNKGYDQLDYIINTIKNNPESRRILLTSYNPLQVNKCVLPPCHSVIHQYAIEDDNKLCLHMYQRSADVFLGLSWNQAQMGMLLVWMAHVINSDENYKGPKLIPHKVLISLGDCHIYENAIEASKELIDRELYDYPKMKINKTSTNFADYTWEDIEIKDYKCHPNNFKIAMIA